MKIAIFFGSTTGNTEDVVDKIYDNLIRYNVSVFDIESDSILLSDEYDYLIFGIPTWALHFPC